MLQNGILISKRRYIHMKPLKNRYSLTLDEDVAEKIKEMAENDDRSFSQYINIILKEWIKAQESDRNE